MNDNSDFLKQVENCFYCRGIEWMCPDHHCAAPAGFFKKAPSPNAPVPLNERVKATVRRTDSEILIDLTFDDCQLGSRIVVGGDRLIADMVESGELHLNADSKLVYDDGTILNIHGIKTPTPFSS